MLAAIVQPFFYQAFIALLLLIMGDFISTFCYHIPEHGFDSLHLQIHHSETFLLFMSNPQSLVALAAIFTTASTPTRKLRISQIQKQHQPF